MEDRADWEGRVVWTCDQWDDISIDDYVTPFARWLQKKGHPGLLARQQARFFKDAGDPDRTLQVRGNMLLNEGITEMLTLLIGGGGTAYNNANARLLVGNHSNNITNDVVATDTALTGASITAVAMDSAPTSYPTVSGTTVTFKMTTSGANHQWNEWSVDNGSGANKNLNKKVESLGNKISGTWSLTAAITIS